MTLTQDKLDDFQIACKPARDWLAVNAHPETSICIDMQSAEIVEGVARVVYEVED